MTRDTQELVEAVRLGLKNAEQEGYYLDADAALAELAERLQQTERLREGYYVEAQQLRERLEAAERKWAIEFDKAHDAERDLASSQDANLLLHRKMEELEKERDEALGVTEAMDAVVGRGRYITPVQKVLELQGQLAERDKRVEELREALEFYAQQSGLGARLASDGGMKARAALADPVVVPAWEWDFKQEC